MLNSPTEEETIYSKALKAIKTTDQPTRGRSEVEAGRSNQGNHASCIFTVLINKADFGKNSDLYLVTSGLLICT